MSFFSNYSPFGTLSYINVAQLDATNIDTTTLNGGTVIAGGNNLSADYRTSIDEDTINNAIISVNVSQTDEINNRYTKNEVLNLGAGATGLAYYTTTSNLNSALSGITGSIASLSSSKVDLSLYNSDLAGLTGSIASLSSNKVDKTTYNSDLLGITGDIASRYTKSETYTKSEINDLIVQSTSIAQFYEYKVDTTSFGPPVTTQTLLFNNATQSSATQIFFSHINNSGVDIDFLLQSITTGKLTIQDTTLSDNNIIFNITGMTVGIDYVVYDVVYVSHTHTFSNNNVVSVLFEQNANNYSKTQIDSILTGITGDIANRYTKAECNTNFQSATGMVNYYDKININSMLSSITGDIANRYTKAECNTNFQSATGMSAYSTTAICNTNYQSATGMTNYYTKPQVLTVIDGASGLTNYYTKNQSNTNYQSATGMTAYYTASQIQGLGATGATGLNGYSNTNATNTLISNSQTAQNATIASNYYNKTESDARFLQVGTQASSLNGLLLDDVAPIGQAFITSCILQSGNYIVFYDFDNTNAGARAVKAIIINSVGTIITPEFTVLTTAQLTGAVYSMKANKLSNDNIILSVGFGPGHLITTSTSSAGTSYNSPITLTDFAFSDNITIIPLASNFLVIGTGVQNGSPPQPTRQYISTNNTPTNASEVLTTLSTIQTATGSSYIGDLSHYTAINSTSFVLVFNGNDTGNKTFIFYTSNSGTSWTNIATLTGVQTSNTAIHTTLSGTVVLALRSGTNILVYKIPSPYTTATLSATVSFGNLEISNWIYNGDSPILFYKQDSTTINTFTFNISDNSVVAGSPIIASGFKGQSDVGSNTNTDKIFSFFNNNNNLYYFLYSAGTQTLDSYLTTATAQSTYATLTSLATTNSNVSTLLNGFFDTNFVYINKNNGSTSGGALIINDSTGSTASGAISYDNDLFQFNKPVLFNDVIRVQGNSLTINDDNSVGQATITLKDGTNTMTITANNNTLDLLSSLLVGGGVASLSGSSLTLKGNLGASDTSILFDNANQRIKFLKTSTGKFEISAQLCDTTNKNYIKTDSSETMTGTLTFSNQQNFNGNVRLGASANVQSNNGTNIISIQNNGLNILQADTQLPATHNFYTNGTLNMQFNNLSTGDRFYNKVNLYNSAQILKQDDVMIEFPSNTTRTDYTPVVQKTYLANTVSETYVVNAGVDWTVRHNSSFVNPIIGSGQTQFWGYSHVSGQNPQHWVIGDCFDGTDSGLLTENSHLISQKTYGAMTAVFRTTLGNPTRNKWVAPTGYLIVDYKAFKPILRASNSTWHKQEINTMIVGNQALTNDYVNNNPPNNELQCFLTHSSGTNTHLADTLEWRAIGGAVSGLVVEFNVRLQYSVPNYQASPSITTW